MSIMEAGVRTYRVTAFNTASASANKIHDDETARRFGFEGGLVPGVDVYAYMTRPPVERWGPAWLERGFMSAKFLAPLYDGREARINLASEGPSGHEGALTVESAGVTCAVGKAALDEARAPLPALADFPHAPPPETRPAASPKSLIEGRVLGSFDFAFDADEHAAYLADVRDELPLYRERRIAHSGWLLRAANRVLTLNVTLGPWIHAASEVRHFGLAHDGDRLSARGRVAGNYERKGHRIVELDVLVAANEGAPVMRIRHTAIYEPRQVRG